MYDNETGLYYLQSRYYDPETGRLLNADDVDYIGYSGEQLSYNAFAYCENNAVCYADYSGKSINIIINVFPQKQWYYSYTYLNGTKYTYKYEFYSEDDIKEIKFGDNYYLAYLIFEKKLLELS